MDRYSRKIYAFLRSLRSSPLPEADVAALGQDEESWWNDRGELASQIAASSDRVSFEVNTELPETVTLRHLISGQKRTIANKPQPMEIPWDELDRLDPRQRWFWLWRFYPEAVQNNSGDALLYPSHRVVSDCAWHSYAATTAAVSGAMFPDDEVKEAEQPYLLLFTFSPVQEFIKASRKFLDFWAGSYLLHYLSARLCWYIALKYGPDAVITPSLWGQEIIDALMVKEFDGDNGSVFDDAFREYTKATPVERFESKDSTSLSTAGFPNVITAIVPKRDATTIGNELSDKLKEVWGEIAFKVRDDIRDRAIEYLTDTDKGNGQLKNEAAIEELIKRMCEAEGLPDSPENPNRKDIKKWKKESCWEWNKLWDAQIETSWEPYWTAVPLGDPASDVPLQIQSRESEGFDTDWKNKQEKVAPSNDDRGTPTKAEDLAYNTLNVGTWWANVQNRLGRAIQAVKNTRNWCLPAAPGERSTLSGRFSAVHPHLNYHEKFREGAGIPSGSLQLFWELMALVYPGLFNGSEKLNAIELTKRMAWNYGGVAESLGIALAEEGETIDYEQLIRFPNLSSIAAARFAYEYPDKLRDYWNSLNQSLKDANKTYKDKLFLPPQLKLFKSKTRRPFHIHKTDSRFRDDRRYNGVMFSARWLADDMNVSEVDRTQNSEDTDDRGDDRLAKLRAAVELAHVKSGFGDSSPSDWWTIVVADGDGMGQYVSGRKLQSYQAYIDRDVLDREPPHFQDFLDVRKRMGPATHVGLNRALLDFSNRIVPYLTERRFCGKVVYSGGDDVLAILPLTDLPEYLISLRSAWWGGSDPVGDGTIRKFADESVTFESQGGYWQPTGNLTGSGLSNSPLFTMGKGATLSAGIVIAHKSVPLPTVLDALWTAEEDRAKEMQGFKWSDDREVVAKDGLCFRIIYGSGNVLEASMKGHLLPSWYAFLASEPPDKLAPLLYRLAEELPKHAALTQSDRLISKAADVIVRSRDDALQEDARHRLCQWLNDWEDWAYAVTDRWEEEKDSKPSLSRPVGSSIDDLAKLLRLGAFWLDKLAQYNSWGESKTDGGKTNGN